MCSQSKQQKVKCFMSPIATLDVCAQAVDFFSREQYCILNLNQTVTSLDHPTQIRIFDKLYIQERIIEQMKC